MLLLGGSLPLTICISPVSLPPPEGHPNARAFVTHAGTHGIYEGICNAVPMVMLPLFGDQSDNVQRMVARGVGEMLNIYDITAEQILTTLNKVINDSRSGVNLTQICSINESFRCFNSMKFFL